jgi:HEAT repeat protein
MEAAAEVLIDQASLFLREGLQDTHPAVRFAACMGLGELAEADAEPAIKPLVHDPDGSVRVAAYFALERLGDLSHRVAWRDALLNNPEPEVRRNAALALGRLHDKHVIPLLRKAFSDDPDDGVRLQALEALAFLGDKYAINRFLLDAYGGVGFKQPFALLTLGRVPGDRVVSALRTRLQYAPYLEARLAAARSLGMQGYDEGYQLALESLDWNEPDAQEKKGSPEVQIMRVRSMAALALGDIGRRDALGALHQTMETETDPRVRLAAATAILNILNDSLAPSRIS